MMMEVFVEQPLASPGSDNKLSFHLKFGNYIEEELFFEKQA